MARATKSGGSKTVRFTYVVERSGQPFAHTLWLAPDKDPELKRAVAAQRVMMVEPGASGGKTDVGSVGFDPSRATGAQILIFPKSLKRFEGARVVGIKFDLVEQPKLENARAPAREPVRSQGRRAAPPPPPILKPQPTAAPTPTPAPKSKAAPHKPRKVKKAPDEPPPVKESVLIREVLAAMKELEAGKAVAAYQRLQRAVS